MAASRSEREDDGLKIDPNFELLALLLALALQEEDAERFIEVYDQIVPKSMSVSEVEGIKDRARELSDLPGGTLLELKATLESEAAVFSSSLGGSLGPFASRRITDSLHHRSVETGGTDHQQGKYLSRSGALLNQRLHGHSKTDGSENERTSAGSEEALSCLGDTGEYSRVDIGSQVGATYIRQQGCPSDSAELSGQQQISGSDFADGNALTTGNENSALLQNQWSTMESASAHNRVQKAQTASVKQPKQLSHPKNSTSFRQDKQVLMNGTVDDVKSRTANFNDKDKHSIKSKPPQTLASLGLGQSTAVTKTPNYSLSHVRNSHYNGGSESDDYAKEEKAALIPKSPPIPDSPPFKSLEEVGHSVGELLTNSQPRVSTCPPPLFLSKVTTTLAYPNSVDGSMAAKAETKYGTIPYSDVNSAVGREDTCKHKAATLPKCDALLNHQLPDNSPEDSTEVQRNSFSTPDVPSHVNISDVNVCSSRDKASDQLDKDDFDGASEEHHLSIDNQWAAAKKKKKKNKKKKTGTGFDTVSINNVKLPVGAPPLLQSPPELRNKHHPKDSHSIRHHSEATLKLESSSETHRHPPPMVSSDSVTSSGESSTDGGSCMNDIGSMSNAVGRNQVHMVAVKRDNSLNHVDSSDDNTNQTSNAMDIDEGKVLCDRKDIRTQENPSKRLQVNTTISEADIHSAVNAQPANQLSKVQPQANQVFTVKSDPSDSDSDKNDTKQLVETKSRSEEQPVTTGKPHSLSEPTACADPSADSDDHTDFIKVNYKRPKKRGLADDHKFAPTQGRHMDRDYFRNRNVFTAGLRKSSSEPTGMSELGDKDTEDMDNKVEPKNLSDNHKKMDTHLTSVLTEPTTVPQSEFSYASKVKSNMKASSLPPKLSPQALLDYVDDDHSDNPASSENSSESVTGNNPVAFDSKAQPSGKSVLDKSESSVAEKSELITASTAKEQFMKNNVRPEKQCSVSQVVKPPDSSSKLGQGRSLQRSSSVDTSEVTKKVSFDDNSLRRTVPPQGPEASVQYLDLTYAGRLKGQRPPVAKAAIVSRQPLTLDAQQTQVAGLKDLKSQPGIKLIKRETQVTSKASIVLAPNPPSVQNEPGRANTVATKPASSNPVSSPDCRPVDEPTNSRPRAPPTPLPTLPSSRITSSSPTPSVGSSTSKPHPMFDLEPQDNFGITFGSVIVGKVGYEILGEDSTAVQRSSPVAELSQVKIAEQPATTPCLSSEAERTIRNEDSGQSANARLDTVVGGETSATAEVSYGKFDGTRGITAALEGKDDNIGDFNHLEVAEMLLTEWSKTQEEIGQDKVVVLE